MGGPARDLVNGRLRLLGLCLAGVLVLWPGRAAAQVVSGTFVGNGTGGRKVTGLGFRPDLVIIKGNDSQGGNEVVVSGVMRTSTMGPGDVSKPVISTCCSPANPASVVVANQITSLDADGFTLGSDRRVAANGITFYWAAFKANANMKVGKYTGDGTGSHAITGLGFWPEFVIVLPENTGKAVQACSATPANRSYEFDVGAWLADQITSLNADGFTVSNAGTYHNANVNTVVYHYVAFNDSPGYVKVGSYSGSGVAQSINGVGFRPEFLFVKFINNLTPVNDPTQSPPAHWRTVSMPYDNSFDYARTAGGQHLQDMLQDGFQIGNAMTINRTFTDCTSGCQYFYVAINHIPLNPPPISVSSGGSTITVTAPTSFELVFNTLYGGGLSSFYDLVEDSGRTADLGGGLSSGAGVGVKTLFHPGILSGGTWYTPGDDTGDPADTWSRWNGSPPKLDLLEATATRVRVRQEAYYSKLCDQTTCTAGTLAGVKGVGDYSVYPSGRLALHWSQSITANVPFTDRDFAMGVFSECPGSCGSLTAYSSSAAIASGGSNPAGDSFLLAKREVDLRRTDFLRVQYGTWALADKTGYDQTVAFLDWRDYSPVVSPLTPGPPETWNYLDYFKPTNFASNADAAVISRSADYRGPSGLTVLTGGPWQALSENTGGGDDFNEAEGAYTLTLDPSQGLSFRIDGSPGTPRRSPVFKIRQWRSFTRPTSVTLEGTSLVADVDYRADVKPVSRGHFASILSWHSTLESPAAITGPDVGSGGTSTGDYSTPARYGNGVLIDQDSDAITFPAANVVASSGAVEFWYQPSYSCQSPGACDVVRHVFWSNVADAQHYLRFEKTAATTLVFETRNGGAGTISRRTVSLPNFGWRLKDWIHLRAEWNAAAPLAADRLRIFVDGREPAHADSGSYTTTTIGTNYIGTDAGGAGTNAFGIIDEFCVYQGVSTPKPLANGGLVGDATEYLDDQTAGKNFPLAFQEIDPFKRGQYLYLGADSQFRGVNVGLSTRGIGVLPGDLDWEYWNGTAWANLESVGGFGDNSRSFTQNGEVFWQDPPTWSVYSVNGGPDLYYVRVHLKAGATYTTAPVEGLIKTDILLFQYYGDIAAPAQTFTFGAPFPTAVELMSFEAAAADGAVDLAWQTGSELDNLGFHLHRSSSSDGPWTRITSSLIPGLGSSPLGASYSWRDTGLVNGTRYYYRLEDVDTASVSTFHGPVSAVPAPVPEPSPPGGDGEGDGGGDGSERGGPSNSSCPSWVLSAAPDVLSPTCTRYGEPESVSLQVLARDSSSATVELHTAGFWALHGAAGGVRVLVPGLEFPSDPHAPALPLRRALVAAVVGKNVELVSAQALDPQTFRGFQPSAVGIAEMAVGTDGTVRTSRRPVRAPRPSRGYLPRDVARLAGTVFQGDRKSAVVEITPVRLAGQALVLARTVRVRLAFTGVADGESGTGSRGRSVRRRRSSGEDVVARLHTSRRGLHAVSFEQLFPQRGLRLSTALLRLQRQGEAVAFHVEPAGPAFGPGSVLYFFADRTAASTDYSSEVAYELVRAPGLQMGVVSAGSLGEPAVSPSTGSASFETNRIYQPGLLDAPDVWLWQAAPSGAAPPPPIPFTLSGLARAGQPSRLVVHLQGGSASGREVDHHVRFLLNGAPVGETTFAGKLPNETDLELPASALDEGTNELGIVNLGDTGVASLVFLDRFEVTYPQASTARGGVFEGDWGEGGTVEVGGLSGPAVVLRDPEAPGWLSGFQASPGSVRFGAEPGRRYLVVSPEGLLPPRIEEVTYSTLRDAANRADYMVITPRAFVEAARPLVERRRSQGLASRAVAFENIASEFGHGQPSAEAIRSFLSYAYHSWQRPSPRYVLLLGDSTVDPRQFVATSGPSPLPALWTKTSYLWTVSDPALAAVNGEDLVPDLAIGRLPAATVAEAQRLVAKVLAWEEAGQDLGGGAVLVADNPDSGGDFEANVEEIRASFLSGRPTSVLKVGELGAATREAILGAFDEGASLMSYVGHGGTAVWAGENVLNDWDVPSLRAQSAQPLLMTMDCLNGYFVTPNLDALPEALLKAEGRGVIGALSPSGLSLDGPAHEYHRAVMAELASGEHARLGDALLAAQRTYAGTGLMPELLDVYQLLGDPATKLR